eukprot:m.128108 g.128108  ORF g.128108 m.128108 type:complete len:312 (+) comp22275_c0_seq2:3695-4630(+)
MFMTQTHTSHAVHAHGAVSAVCHSVTTCHFCFRLSDETMFGYGGFGGGYGGFGGFGGFGYDDDMGSLREGFARKSAAASRREGAARDAFTTAVLEVEIPPKAKFATVTNLLAPSTHLTNASWTDFSKWVRSHPGCRVTRRVASDAEKAAHKETRKGKCYWVDAKISREAHESAVGKAAPAPAPAAVSAGPSGGTAVAADAAAAAAPTVAMATAVPDSVSKRKADGSTVSAVAGGAPSRPSPSKKRRSTGPSEDSWMNTTATTMVQKMEAATKADGTNWMLDAMQEFGKGKKGKDDPLAGAILKEMSKKKKR